MDPIELTSTDEYEGDCPSCGCTLNPWSGDIEDPICSEEYYTVSDYDDTLDGYLYLSTYEYYYIDDNTHGCGCNCRWTDSDDLVSALESEVSSASEQTLGFECGHCHNRYAKLSEAESCCKPNTADKMPSWQPSITLS